MGLTEGLKFILANAESIGVVAIILVVLFVVIFGVVTDRLHFGPEWKRTTKRCDTLEATVKTLTDTSTEARILAAESRVRIEFLEAENDRKQEELDRMARRLESVEAELFRIRETWNPPRNRGTS